MINLSLTDGQIIPTTVGELLKLAMPKNMFEDDMTEGKPLIYYYKIYWIFLKYLFKNVINECKL